MIQHSIIRIKRRLQCPAKMFYTSQLKKRITADQIRGQFLCEARSVSKTGFGFGYIALFVPRSTLLIKKQYVIEFIALEQAVAVRRSLVTSAKSPNIRCTRSR